MIEPNIEIGKAWIKSLLDPTSLQAHDILGPDPQGGYCCLGHLACLLPGGVKANGDLISGLVWNDIWEDLGFSLIRQNALSNRNDGRGVDPYTLPEIAEYILTLYPEFKP